MQYFVFFLFLFFLLSFPVHGSSDVTKTPFRYCSNATFSPNSTYLADLKILFSALSSNSSTKLYHSSSVGQPPNPTAYGDFQCRGDLDPTACRQCVAAATTNWSQDFCPLSVGAVIWLDECILRYSNQSFFSVTQEWPLLIMWNVLDVGKDVVKAFDKAVVAAFHATVSNASSMSGVLKFATNEANFRDETIYTMAQCIGNLSNFNCEECLRIAIQNLQYYCSGKKGARILSLNCMLRYELYRFYGNVSPSLISSPPVPASVPIVPPPPDFSSAPAPPLLSGKWRAAMIGVVTANFLWLDF